MTYYYSGYYVASPYDLQHHGILGMKWGVRRYQNKDGTLTAEGKKRYGTVEKFEAERAAKKEKAIKVAKTAGKVALGVGAAALAGTGGLVALNNLTGVTLSNLGPAVSAGRKAISDFNKELKLSEFVKTMAKYGADTGYYDEHGQMTAVNSKTWKGAIPKSTVSEGVRNAKNPGQAFIEGMKTYVDEDRKQNNKWYKYTERDPLAAQADWIRIEDATKKKR